MNYDMKTLARDFWYGKPHQERRLGDLYIDKTGLYKHREWRGFKDTMYYFYNIWMYNYAHMVMDVVRYGGLINFAEDAQHIGSIGKDDGHCEIKLDNGELCMRGGDVMLGYYKDPEGTAEVVDAEGWFHTGDLARVDEDGYYFLTGRKKNVIILDSGENVSPEELEKLLVPCADIQECIVKEKDKKICALIYCDPAKQDAVKEFVTGVNRGLPLYKRMVPELSAQPLPRNAMGKLLR